VQRYEGASTQYGPHTLDAYIQTVLELVKVMACNMCWYLVWNACLLQCLVGQYTDAVAQTVGRCMNLPLYATVEDCCGLACHHHVPARRWHSEHHAVDIPTITACPCFSVMYTSHRLCCQGSLSSAV
jgi:hypothetical protein